MNCETVEVGDRFLVNLPRRNEYIGVVTKTTKTRFEIDGVVFFKKYGSEYGNRYGAYVSEITPEIEASIELHLEKHRLVKYLKGVDFLELDIDVLRALKNFIEDASSVKKHNQDSLKQYVRV